MWQYLSTLKLLLLFFLLTGIDGYCLQPNKKKVYEERNIYHFYLYNTQNCFYFYI
jgi:hypothetical protein